MKSVETISAKIGDLRFDRSNLKKSKSLITLIAPLISSIPYIKIEKPTKICPNICLFGCRDIKIRHIPAKDKRGVKVLGLIRVRIGPLSLIPERLIIQAVSVVPTFEPIIIPNGLSKLKTPELTRPTSITVTVDEDCSIAVIPAP